MRNFARFFLLILIFPIFSFHASAASWQKQDSGTLGWLHAVYFFDQMRGFVVGSNGVMLKTVNGGATWEKVKKPTEDNLRDLIFVDQQTGWLLCERNQLTIKTGEARSYLLRTTDGGQTWKKFNFFNNIANSLVIKFVAAPGKIRAVGEVGTLYALSPKTNVWKKQDSPTGYLLNSGNFISGEQGWLVGAGGTLLSTVDDGITWRDAGAATRIPKIRLNAVFFVSPKTGWLAGANGKNFSTIDGGRIWREQDSGTAADLLDLYFANELSGVAIGDAGTILSTQNGGISWEQETVTGSPRRLERLFFVNQNHGWAVGFGGSIYAFSK